ncbi:sulfurtransferase, partial [Acinetobacter baumannii]|nr:sulfurtransferase [Acinetobacter baumannii]
MSTHEARDRVLVEPEELAARLERGERVVLLDVRGSMTGPPGRPEHEAGHLPGAVFVDLETELSGPHGPGGGRHRLPEPEAFQAVMRAAGVDDDVPVVAYDGANSLYAARLW